MNLLTIFWKLDYQNVLQIKLSICSALCIALWLAQLRLSANIRTAQEIEQCASYKRIKKAGVISAESPVVSTAATIATIKTLAFVCTLFVPFVCTLVQIKYKQKVQINFYYK